MTCLNAAELLSFEDAIRVFKRAAILIFGIRERLGKKSMIS